MNVTTKVYSNGRMAVGQVEVPDGTHHVCGLQGFSPMHGDSCPMCNAQDAAYRDAVSKLNTPTKGPQ